MKEEELKIIDKFDSELAFIKLFEQHQQLIERVIRLEKRLKQHCKDEYGHTWEQRPYD
jgi:hypothetical protein